MHRLALTFFASVILLWLVVMAALVRASALPPEATGTMLAVFPPATPSDHIFASLTRANARIVKETGLGFVWIVSAEDPGLAGRLVEQGAMGAYRDLPISPTIAGCFAYADAAVANAFQL